MKWLVLFLGIMCNASASVLVKFALMPPREFPSLSNLRALLTNWPIFLGLALYGTAFFLYTAALAKLPLNIAHPVLTAGGIFVVALCSFFIFNEPFYWSTLLGLFFVITGVILISTQFG